MSDFEPLSADQLTQLDRELMWHPYSSFVNPSPVFPVAGAQGVHIHLSHGRKLVDGMASWWSQLHGYNHPVLNSAIHAQLKDMAHVMVDGLTNEPAVRLRQPVAEVPP